MPLHSSQALSGHRWSLVPEGRSNRTLADVATRQTAGSLPRRYAATERADRSRRIARGTDDRVASPPELPDTRTAVRTPAAEAPRPAAPPPPARRRSKTRPVVAPAMKPGGGEGR